MCESALYAGSGCVASSWACDQVSAIQRAMAAGIKAGADSERGKWDRRCMCRGRRYTLNGF